MTDTYLYLSTASGLETWTNRTWEYYIMQKQRDQTSPFNNRKSGESLLNSVSTSFPNPCLIGLQPYIGLTKLAVSSDNIFLLSIYEESKLRGWNLYSLHHTPVNSFFEEIISKAMLYMDTDPVVYLQLLLEAHFLVVNTRDEQYNDLMYRSASLLAQVYSHFIYNAE